MRYPFVTFIIPTLNAEKYLDLCFNSINKQTYPKDKMEVLVVDGGSKDKTLEISAIYGFKVINNPKVDQETGKAIGINKSKGEIIVLMDSDNEIKGNDWLKKMVYPLGKDNNLFGVESNYFYKECNSVFNKYSMVLHIADPFSRMISTKLKKRSFVGYDEYTIPDGRSYPLGANGFLWNKKIIDRVGVKGTMFEESNFSYYVMKSGFRRFARVPKCGIYHYHINSFSDFVNKRLKIGNKFLNRKEENKRTWLEGISPLKFVYSFIYCATFIGPIFEAIFNCVKTREVSWLIHPLMCFTSVSLYSYTFVKRKLSI